MALLGDRFARVGESWIDIATADRVSVVVRRAGVLRAQIAWAERCAMLGLLRHPLLNPLVDFGVASAESFFEAYARQDAVAVTATSAARLIEHANRFLEAHGVPACTEPAVPLRRELRRVPSPARGRAVGIVLQPRRAFDTIAELLSVALPGGATSVRVSGAAGSGMRTLIRTVARLARVHGYVPACPQALLRWPALLDELAGRHVCLLVDGAAPRAEREMEVQLLTRLAARSARPHICLYLHRTAQKAAAGRPVVHLEPMGTTSMTSMTYIDPECGPCAEEIVRAAQKAGGLPGRFLAELGAAPFPPLERRHALVHETAPAYSGAEALSTASPAPRGTSRIRAVLGRAVSRVAQLQGRGRHAAASRLLARAARVLEGRGDGAEAARCWLELAWIARNRGATPSALQFAERAGRANPEADNQLAAGCVRSICWTDEGRLQEAEASLRSLIVAAAAHDVARPSAQSGEVGRRCTLALGRVLYWQGCGAETLALISPLLESPDPATACEALSLAAKAHNLAGDGPSAVRAARAALLHSAALPDPRLRAAASRSMAQALCAAGDLDGVRTHVASGLAAASEAHLPLHAVKLRAVLVRALAGGDPADGEGARLRAGLERSLRRPMPPLLRAHVEAAVRNEHSAQGQPWPSAPGVQVPPLEAFLEIAQRGRDDLGAMSDVAAALCERIKAASVAILAVPDGRALIVAGRPWRARAGAAAQVLASGLAVVLENGPDGTEAAEPVRCGGELVGAVSCRWTLGTPRLFPTAIGLTLKAAAMAIASHLRMVVDSVPPEPPSGAWGDLLGDSAVAAALRDSVQRAARAPFPVLIQGESGSGKELVARAIHRLSARHTRRFCAINCAALGDELIEAELFGHTRGAFTGAMTERAGLFEEADGGTLFLDEVGELSARAQAKLLRAIQEGEVRRVGENLPRRVDVRIVAATNRCLEQEAAHGRFRTDLRFRLDVLRVLVPPLRERTADIPLLTQHFWRQACARVGSSASLGPDTLAALSRHDWPGNVRELQNAIAWMAVNAPRRGRVSTASLPAHVASHPVATGTFEAAREAFERRFVRAALVQAGGHRLVAAKALGVSRQGLAKMMRRLRIDPADGETPCR